MLNKTDWEKFANATGASTNDLNTIEGVTKVAEQYYNWTDSLTAAPNDGKAFLVVMLLQIICSLAIAS